jgi:Uma2 family endonuclease
MTVREFLEWEAKQPHKYEFEDGLIKLMAGGTKRHEKIKRNIVSLLTGELRGKACEPYGSDLKGQTFPGPVYYPDATVDCGTNVDDDTMADKPTVIFKVLSKSTRKEDLENKLPNYQATPAVREIVYVETERMHLMVWRRNADGAWEESEVIRPDQLLELASVGASLTLAVIYEGVGW